jgi:filamentous hemagglutinin family protein
MNHIYRSIWSNALGTWVAVSEHCKSKGKRSSSALLATGLLLASPYSLALPTGNQLVAGQATVSTPNTNTLQVNQASQNAIINWQGFSVGPYQAVNIQQPNAQAALLNRVVGQNASQIQGQINANGQVYLINPNGVLFSKTAQVDVSGLVASTHNISNADFMSGNNHFTQDGATGTVQNDGTISTQNGGVVALIGTSVTNTGNINTPNGTTVLAAGKTIDLDFQGNGLVEVKVSEAALNAQITNKGAIQADGGRVVMSAQAAGQLIDTVINQQGIVRAQGMSSRNGEIILDGGSNGTIQVSGTVDASSHNTANNATGGNVTVTGAAVNIQSGALINASGDAGGGTVVIGDKQNTSQTTIQDGAKVTAQATDHGNAGNISVFASMNNGTVTVAGNLDASAPKNGNGGFIDTSAAQVKTADTTKISTKAANGKTGTWLIDPTDFTIAASGGDITGAALSNSLLTTSVTIASTNGANGVNGDVNVNDIVSWAANTLTLNAQRNININANLNGSGTAQLFLQYGQASANGGINDNYFINNGATINLPAGQNFSTQKGTNTSNRIDYTVIDDITTLQGITSGDFVLGANIDASATSSWNGGAGFSPLNGVSGYGFSGIFDGLNHVITGLTINQSSNQSVGLFGMISSGTVQNVGLVGSLIGSSGAVGGAGTGSLAGFNSGTINNVYATGNVTGTGTNNIGGLVGINYGTINTAYVTGNVTGNSYIGGLVGLNYYSGSITNAYSTANVSGTDYIGGLVGQNQSYYSNPFINNTYAAGSVSGSGLNVGGLVGANTSLGGGAGKVTNSFWNTQTTGQSVGIGSGDTTGATGSTTAGMMQMSTFSNAVWSIENTGSGGTTWRIYEGNTMPLLSYWLTPLTINATVSESYNGLVHNSLSNASYSISNAPSSGHLFYSNSFPFGTNAINVGAYPLMTGIIYSDQQGYNIASSGTLSITPANLTITANNASKTYGQFFSFNGTEFFSSGLQNGETIGKLSLSSTGAIATAPVIGSPYPIIASNATGGTFNPSNYAITYNNGTLSVNPASLIITANNASKIFGQFFSFNGTEFFSSGLQNGETIARVSLASLGTTVGASVAGSPYPIYASNATGGSFNPSNYNITYINGIFKVTPNITFNDNVAGLVTSFIERTFEPNILFDNANIEANDPDAKQAKTQDSTDNFTGYPIPNNPFINFVVEDEKKRIVPKLSIRNSAGKVKVLHVSEDGQFLSLLLEDGTVRVWDLERGVQRNIVDPKQTQVLTDIGAVNNKGELLSIAGTTGIGIYDIVGAINEDKLSIKGRNVNHFANSSDGNLLLVNLGANNLRLWDNHQHKELWQLQTKRGEVNRLAMSDDKLHAAMLSRQEGVYGYDTKLGQLKQITDAIDIIDIKSGNITSTLPNVLEQVVYMRFKDDNTLQLGLANGELIDWSLTTNSKKSVSSLVEKLKTVDNKGETYAYTTENGIARVGDAQGNVQLSIQNKDNFITDARLLGKGEKLLTVLESGDLALWDIASGKKMLRLFSSKQNGWTVMDAFGRFDGSEDAMENFTWIAENEEIPLDSFSENYYEPGLLATVLQGQDYLNNDADRVVDGISLPPKVDLQLAAQQTDSDKVAVQLKVFDRGGGIDKVNIYHNGKLINHDDLVVTPTDGDAEQRTLTLKVTPNAGKNTIRVVASNELGIENGDNEISFDGKTKAYDSSTRLMSVGINRYSDRNLNLAYSVADANLIQQTIKDSGKLTASKLLIDQHATKPHILAELKELSQGAQQDVLMIYLAGHGMALGKEWYFLPYETKMQPTLEQIAATGITATELSDIFKDSRIQHILLVVDSCYSGAGMDAFSKLENGQRYLSRKLGRSLGITIVTAAAKNQEASELKSLGHGVFTYLMSQEMEKKQTNEPITAHSIALRLAETLPLVSKQMTGTTQDPAVYMKGDDFTLRDLIKDKK